MAKPTKRLLNAHLDAIKDAALQSVAEIAKPTTSKSSKSGVFTARDIDAIKDKKSRENVKTAYDAYVQATKDFIEARKKSEDTKFRLQHILNIPFIKLGLISDDGFWKIEGLDAIGSIRYEDNPDADFRDAYQKTVDKRDGKRTATVKDRGDEWDDAWKLNDESTPDDETEGTDIAGKGTSQGTSQGTGRKRQVIFMPGGNLPKD